MSMYVMVCGFGYGQMKDVTLNFARKHMRVSLQDAEIEPDLIMHALLIPCLLYIKGPLRNPGNPRTTAGKYRRPSASTAFTLQCNNRIILK